MDPQAEQETAKRLCKICQSEETEEDSFKMPCKCRGSMSYIHKSCLYECLKISKGCGICGHKFNYFKVYQENMPASLPLKYILRAARDSLLELLSYAVCVGYLGARLYAIFKINYNIILRCISGIEEYGHLFPTLLALFLILINYFYQSLFTTVSKMLGGVARIRINPQQALHELAGDVISHTENRSNHGVSRMASSIHDSVTELESSMINEEEDIDEASSTVSISVEYDGFEFFKNGFHLPTTFSQIKTDLGILFSFTWCPLLVLGLYTLLDRCYSSFMSFKQLRILFLESLFRFKRLPRFMYKFVYIESLNIHSILNGCSLSKPLFFVHHVIILTALTYLFLNFITNRVRSPFFTSMLYTIKLVLVYPMNTYYGYFVIGTLTHVFFASMVNHGTPLCYCNNSLLSVLIHSIVGMVFSRFTYNFKRNLLSSYRDGLVVNYRYLEHYRSPCVTRVLFESRWSLLLIKSCENLIFTSLVAFASVYMYSMFSTPVYIADTCSKYIFIKLIALLYVVSGDLGNLIANICLYTICFFSRIFEADNYLFNKPFPLVDKSRLVWDANVKTEVAILKRKAREINNRLAYHRKSGSGDQQISVSESASDGLQEIEDTMSSRIESTLLPSVKTSRKLRKIDEDEKKFLKKYSVNDKKIEKYYCKTHKGKFSLFYYPRYFPVFVFFTILSCIISGTGFLYSLFFISHYFTGLVIPGNSFVFGVFFISASRLVAAFASNRQQSIFLYVKQLFLVFFTNILWPGILAALYICFYYDNSALIRVSELFVSFWAFSFILHHCVVRIMGIRSFSDGYTVYKFIRGLVSLTALGSTIICSVLICRRYFDFNSLVLVISSIFFAYYTALFLGELVSGTWFEKIRDKYFLKEVAVADYEICSE